MELLSDSRKTMNTTAAQTSNTTICWIPQPSRSDPIIMIGLIALPVIVIILWIILMQCECKVTHGHCDEPFTHRYRCTSVCSNIGSSNHSLTSSSSIMNEIGSMQSSKSRLIDITSSESPPTPCECDFERALSDESPPTKQKDEIIDYVPSQRVATYV